MSLKTRSSPTSKKKKSHLCLPPALLLGLGSESHQCRSTGSQPPPASLSPPLGQGPSLIFLITLGHFIGGEGRGGTHILPQEPRSGNCNKLLACGGGGDSRMPLYVSGVAA